MPKAYISLTIAALEIKEGPQKLSRRRDCHTERHKCILAVPTRASTFVNKALNSLAIHSGVRKPVADADQCLGQRAEGLIVKMRWHLPSMPHEEASVRGQWEGGCVHAFSKPVSRMQEPIPERHEGYQRVVAGDEFTAERRPQDCPWLLG